MATSQPEPGIPQLDLPAHQLAALLPRLGTAGLAGGEAGSAPERGRILKLRLGMNPNSSSVGTNVIVFMWTLVSCSAVFSLAAGLLVSRFSGRAEESKEKGL